MIVTVTDNTFIRHGIAFDVQISVDPDETGFRVTYVLKFKDGNGYIDDFPPKITTEFIAKNATQSINTLWTDMVTKLTARAKTKFP